jgi:hypothetical protein
MNLKEIIKNTMRKLLAVAKRPNISIGIRAMAVIMVVELGHGQGYKP